MNVPRIARALFVLAVVLSACTAPQPLPTPTPPVPPTLTPSQTGTIVWFPPTRTPTPMPSVIIEPTVAQRIGVGSEILSDDFSDASRWSHGESAAGRVSVGSGELTLANPGERGLLFSLRSSTNLSDFYLEMTSNVSLCRGDDSYGVLLRSASAQDFYRFVVTCAGQIRLERVVNGQAALLQDWLYSGQVPPGSPLVLRLGVWAVGGEMRFFINDYYQFTASDPVFRSGGVGVFSRVASGNPLTVSFSNLTVYSVDPGSVVMPTRTPPGLPTTATTPPP